MKLFRKNEEEGSFGKRFSKRLANARDRFEIIRSQEGILFDRQRTLHHLVCLIVLALVVTVTIEMFNRRDVGKFFIFVFNYPLVFLLDYLLVFNTLLISQLFRRRYAVICLISLFWITMSVVNYVVICFRTQPFTLADVMLVGEMFSLITIYFTWIQIIGIFLAAAALIAAIVFLFIKAPRRERVNFVAAIIMLAVVTAGSFGCITIGKNSGFITERFTSIKDAYQKYGFAYTFLDTFADIGISRPDEYNPDVVHDIAEKTGIEDDDDHAMVNEVVMPNIVFVQLESFFDADTLADDIIVSGNATPNFHRMMRNWPSGTLYVPVVGGGTANTEFEILTGMNMDDFGAGEYPYFTVARDMPIESAATVLTGLGYDATAVHNYMATFYGRNEVYANLGFQVFEPMEYMDDLNYGEVGWAEDDIIIDSTIEAMEATPGRDFVFSVTVGTHGKYPTDGLLSCAANSRSIRVIEPGAYLDEKQLANYLNLAVIMDDFIVDFIDAMEDFDEPVIVVFYGDHLPALDWNESCIDSGNLFETQYFIWNNYGAKFTGGDIEAYRLTANIFGQLGIDDGAIFKFHQSYNIRDNGVGYLTELEILEYDILYGERDVYDGEYPFIATDIQMGIDEININACNLRYGRLMVKGQNFNEFSKIVLDGEVLPTVYVDSHTLAAVMDKLPEDAESLVVAQISNEDIELSRTEEFPVEDIIQ